MSTQSRPRRRRRSADSATKVAAYSLATGAGICVGGQVAAAPVLYDPPGLPIFVGPGESFGVDFDNSGTVDLLLERDLLGDSSTSSYLGTIVDTLPLSGFAEFHAAGADIGGDVSGWGPFTSLNEFLGRRGFLGVRFKGADLQDRFAYLDIALDAAPIATFGEGGGGGAVPANYLTIYGGAYESVPNVPITTVPEPGGLALLAMGVAGLAARRRARADNQ